jgi:predicted unusual protein kinase regulating ubiquinone biosynthesis (AarF/ABC1/UbiB family)
MKKLVWLACGSAIAYSYNNPDSPLSKLNRFRATTWTVACIVLDYKRLALLGHDTSSAAYASAQSECHLRAAKRMLDLAKNLKGVYIKAGQHIASLKPAVPREYTETLGVLCDRAPSRPFEEVRRTVEQELGDDLEAIFLTFDKEPLGTASLAQVHKAQVLATDTITGKPRAVDVAVKVQHRAFQAEVHSDLATFWLLSSLVKSVFANFEFAWVLPKFEQAMAMEQDFRLEALNAALCAKHLQASGERRAYVPHTFAKLSSPKVLTMEFINGVPVNNIPAIAQLGLSAKEVAGVLVDMFAEQIMVHGFVHCDPHPGNVLVRAMPRNTQSGFLRRWVRALLRLPAPCQVVLLDHGLYRALGDEFRHNYCRLWRGLVQQNPAQVRTAAQNMGIEQYAHVLPLLLTHRPLDSATPLGGTSAADNTRLREKVSLQLATGTLANHTPRGEKVATHPRPRTEESKREAFSDQISHSQGAASGGEKLKLGGTRTTLAEASAFLEALPEDFLFVLKTQNYIRVLNHDLGGTSRDRFLAWSKAAVRGAAVRSPVAEAHAGLWAALCHAGSPGQIQITTFRSHAVAIFTFTSCVLFGLV